MSEIMLSDESDNVTELKVISRLDQFATLATRLDSLNVTPFSLERHPCHVCYPPKLKVIANGTRIVLQRLTIAMEEGHLEVSQPVVGRAMGWPQRMVALRSLWVDFTFWCLKSNFSKYQKPEQSDFHDLLDQLFIRNGDKYELPNLQDCRDMFIILRRNYECT